MIPAFGLIFCRKASTRRDRKNIIASLSFFPAESTAIKDVSERINDNNVRQCAAEAVFHRLCDTFHAIVVNVTLICGVITKLL